MANSAVYWGGSGEKAFRNTTEAAAAVRTSSSTDIKMHNSVYKLNNFMIVNLRVSFYGGKCNQ